MNKANHRIIAVCDERSESHRFAVMLVQFAALIAPYTKTWPLAGGLAIILALAWSSCPAAPAQEPVDARLRQLLYEAARESKSFQDRFDAEVWLMDMSQRLTSRVPDAEERLQLLRAIHEEATRAGLAPELVLAVMEVESNFDRFAISTAGARGLMQVMPFWLDEIGRPEDNLFNVQTNLRYGCTILRYYLDMENDNLGPALARYNGSHGRRVYPDKVFSALSARWFRH